MAEYIDREALFAEFDRLGLGEHSIVEKVFSIGVRTIIAGMPAADVAPVVHGRWEEADWVELDGGGNELIRTPNAALRCSVCCNCFKKELLWKDAFCPNCGTKMDGGAENAVD